MYLVLILFPLRPPLTLQVPLDAQFPHFMFFSGAMHLHSCFRVQVVDYWNSGLKGEDY